MKPSFAIVGCGRTGSALGFFLRHAGYPLHAMVSRTLASAAKAADWAGAERFGATAPELIRDADVIFLTTPDGVIEEACSGLVEMGAIRKGVVVMHCSGSLPSTILDAARQVGAKTGSMHPLQSFAAVQKERNPFEGIIVAVEGDAEAVAVARQMATDLGAISLAIRTESKTLYHASAVVASNYLVTLMDFAFQLLGQAGIEMEDAFKVLGPLVRGTLNNIEKAGPVKSLTGPIVRGDLETVRQHIAGIAAQAPHLLRLYKMMGIYTVNVGVANGGLIRERADEIKRLLEE
jgi:predicted short-subunit dehydrogenase-like oxidoreductase (DUF2520 family)